MKRITAIILALMTAASLVLSSGCSIVTRGSDYCYKFLDYIKNEEFDKAYEMIADSIKAPESETERAERLKAEEKAKAEKSSFWKELFGLDKAENANATPAPTATPENTEEPTATPGEAVSSPAPSSTPTPLMENGYTPDPETGEYPQIDSTPTPDANADPSPDLPLEPGTSPESDVATPAPTDAPTPTPKPAKNKNDKATPTPTATPATTGEPTINETITKVAFIDKYKSIFDELQLSGIDYTTTDVTDGEIVAIVNYNLTYHSKRGGDLSYAFEIRADRIEHRWAIAWSPSLLFPMMEWGDNLRVGTLQANRGEILCSGEPYAQNVYKVTVFAVPSTIENMEDFVRQTAAVSELEMTEDDVIKAINNQRNDFAKLQEFFPDEVDADLKSRILEIKGLALDTANYGTLRYYPYGSSLCHIIGYAGIISKKEKTNYEAYGDVRYDEENHRFYTTETRYNGDSWIGKYGLELLYEDDLLGTNGRFTYIQDAKGGSRGMLYSTPAVDGKDLHLTIIPEIQERLEDIVDTVVYDEKIHGCVVVLNPRTGAIQAITSWPGFDLNYLARGMPEDEWEAMQSDPDIPLYNRATQGLYTPGSVFKTLTSAALLETNTMTASDVFPGSEEIDVDEWMPSEHFMASLKDRANTESFSDQSNGRPLRRTGNTNRHTPMNMTSSVIDSDNLFFAYGALRMGWNKFETYLVTKLGWNTPIKLEAENTKPRIYWRSGADKISWQNVAEGGETIWKQNDAGEWQEVDGVHLVLDKDLIYGLDVSTPQLYDTSKVQSDYDLAVTGYGQGQILMSPLQIACYVSAYANDGDIMQPYLVDSIWQASGTSYSLIDQRTPTVYKHLLQKSTVDMLYPALQQVCVEGTARHMNKSFITKGPISTGYTFAGKTGTAEIDNDKTKELAWFVCWRDRYTDNSADKYYKDIPSELRGQRVIDDDARLVCVMLEINLLTAPAEWAQMKYDITRAILEYDVLNNDDLTKSLATFSKVKAGIG